MDDVHIPCLIEGEFIFEFWFDNSRVIIFVELFVCHHQKREIVRPLVWDIARLVVTMSFLVWF